MGSMSYGYTRNIDRSSYKVPNYGAGSIMPSFRTFGRLLETATSAAKQWKIQRPWAFRQSSRESKRTPGLLSSGLSPRPCDSLDPSWMRG